MVPDRILHKDNGYRVFRAIDAYNHIKSALKSQGLKFQSHDLAYACDLGFHVIAVESDPILADYTRRSFVHYGKGASLIQARTSGMYEAIERYSSIYVNETNTLHGSFNSLAGKGYDLIDLSDYLLPTPWNVKSNAYYSSDVRRLYRHDLNMVWYKTISILEKKDVYLPVCLTHTLKCDDAQNRIFSNRPNGIASGMTREEAVLQGMLEVIERDCECIFVGNSLPMPEVDPGSVNDSEIIEFLIKARKKGVDVVIKYIANDIGLPAFYTMLYDPQSSYQRICWGSGTHLSKAVALKRSITEAIQDRVSRAFRLRAFANVVSNNLPSDSRWEAKCYGDLASGKADHRIRYVYKHNRMIRYEDINGMEYESIQAAIRKVIARLRAGGIRKIYVADLGRFGIPTVRVIIPELEFMPKIHYAFRKRSARSRRLCRVPERLGYREGVDYEYKSGLRNNFLI